VAARFDQLRNIFTTLPVNPGSMRSLFLIIYLVFSLPLLALNPSTTYQQRPEKFNMVYDEHSVETNDGVVLTAWYFPARIQSTQLVLISHDGEGNMADNLRQADVLIAAGYNVMMYDYRGFGTSSPFEIDPNMYIYPHFQDDVKAMIDFCRTTYAPQFSLYGWGIGAGLSLGIGYDRPEVERIIADTPFQSMEDMEERFSALDEPMEVPFAGYERKHEPIITLDGEPSKSLKGILLIVGNNDPLFKISDMEELRKKRKTLIRSVVVINNPDRLNNFMADRQSYASEMISFLKS
jgi:pimeloyl-ACP methyl ester carboxylesterase